MAALASSQVSLYPTEVGKAEFYPRGKDDRTVITRRLKITSLAQGDATDTIGASALGFTDILSCGTLWDATNSKGYPTVIDPVDYSVGWFKSRCSGEGDHHCSVYHSHWDFQKSRNRINRKETNIWLT